MVEDLGILSDAELDEVSGGLSISLDDIIGAVKTGVSALRDGVCIDGGGVSTGPCNPPTNGEVYSAFFNGVNKGMGK